jgi:hypothetical protein
VNQSVRAGTLPNLIIIGAMKCGTTALHRYLSLHPDVSASEPKELNFFCGPERPDAHRDGEALWHAGNWHRGVGWYAARFRPAPVRVEASPGYTSPSFPNAADRMARVVPEARLVYLVRDPIERAVSQYRHHHAEGAEKRPIEEALPDPQSQYLARSRYHERLKPYLDRFPRERILILAQEDLQANRRTTVREVYRFAGVDDAFWSPGHEQRWNASGEVSTPLDGSLRRRLAAELADDADRLRELTGWDFPGWRV